MLACRERNEITGGGHPTLLISLRSLVRNVYSDIPELEFNVQIRSKIKVGLLHQGLINTGNIHWQPFIIHPQMRIFR